MLILSIILSFLLLTSVCINVLFFRRIEYISEINEIYTKWIVEWKNNIFKTYSHMKMLDQNQVFEKDDDVGVAFKDLVFLIKDLNDKIEDETDV